MTRLDFHSTVMKKLTLPLFCLALLTGIASAQVLQPATISVTSTFTNPAGAVKSRLENAAGPGVHLASATGGSAEASPRTATSDFVSILSNTSASVNLTVDAAGSPQWRVSSRLRLRGYGEDYYFGPSAPIATVPGGSYLQTFSSVVSIVDMTFSAAVSGGTVIVTTTDGTRTLAALSLPAGNRAEIVVPGGEPLVIKLAVETGSGGTAGSLRRVVRTLNTWSGADGVPADTIVPVNLNISDPATLGALTGTFDVTGEAELAGATTVQAMYFSVEFPGYGAWVRSFSMPGDPASGAFTLGNLTSDPGPISAYGVQGTAFLKNTLPSGNKAVQLVRTKMLSSPTVPAVPGGGTASMGGAMAMTPGFIRGTITLCGPVPVPGITPVLHGIVTPADNDADADGVPDGAVNTDAWLNASGIVSRTVADVSNTGGAAQMVMERTVSGADVTCEYELICPSPLSGPAVEWTDPAAFLLMANDVNSEAEYFNTRYVMHRRGAPASSLAPGGTDDRSYTANMGEVTLIIRSASPAVNIWQPQLQWHPGPGGLTDAPANPMIVESISAYGWPRSAAAAAQQGRIRTLLPAGTYTVRPTVNTVSASGPGTTTLIPFTITVPPRGRVSADNGLAVSANVPPCIGANATAVNGNVTSDGSPVTAITFSIDGAAAQNATFVPGLDPAYSLNLPAGLAPGMHTITITVTTADGRTASSTQIFERDITPPVITCPQNIFIYAETSGPQVVNYPAPTATDNCGGTIVFTCNPPSGSPFPPGSTSVACTAFDGAGNSAGCFFDITIVPPCPPPVRSHRYSAASGTHFRYENVNAWHANPVMTVMAWVKRTGAASDCETIISQNYLQSFWFGFCSATGQLRFYRSGGSFADSTGTVPVNQWTHVAAAYDGSTVQFYVNGVAAGTSLLANAGMGNADPITIGGDFTEGSYNYGFTGLLDEILIYGRALGEIEVQTSMREQSRTGLLFAAAFGSGGSSEELSFTIPSTISTPPPVPEIEGMLPRYLVVPRITGVGPGVNGEVDTAVEYAGAEKMVIRYRDGANGIQDAVAHLKFHNEPGDRALYVGVTNVRDVIAPWTRAQSWIALQVEPGGDAPNQGEFAGAGDFRVNSRRLDGSLSFGLGTPPTGFERGDGAGNYGPLPPGDPLISTPSPFGLIGAGGDTVEFRLDLSVFGGDWQRALRIGVSHHWISGVGMDANAPIGAGFERPWTWSDVLFSGFVPELQHSLSGNTLTLQWTDARCGFALESSTTLQPGSWASVAAPVFMNYRDDILRFIQIDITGRPRDFFRLRR